MIDWTPRALELVDLYHNNPTTLNRQRLERYLTQHYLDHAAMHKALLAWQRGVHEAKTHSQ